MLYQRRTRYVTAWRINTADWGSCELIASWCGGDLVDPADYQAGHDLDVIWLDGWPARDGEWIVRVEDGGYQVMTDALFNHLFRPAETDQ